MCAKIFVKNCQTFCSTILPCREIMGLPYFLEEHRAEKGRNMWCEYRVAENIAVGPDGWPADAGKSPDDLF